MMRLLGVTDIVRWTSGRLGAKGGESGSTRRHIMTNPLGHLWIVFSLLTACGGGETPKTIEACETAQCRQAFILEAWPEDQEKAWAMIEALPVRLEQEAAVSKLLDAHPAEVEVLCNTYGSESTLGRCKRVKERSHLFSRLPPPRPTVGRLGGGPANSRLYPSIRRESPYWEVEANTSVCTDEVDVNGCLWRRAQNQAEQGAPEAAVSLCHAVPLDGVPPPRWRSECLFLAAERLVFDRHHERYGDAVDLCMTAQLYRPNCLAHLLQNMGREAPKADFAAPEGWAYIQAVATSVRTAWQNDAVRDVMVSRLWSEATGHAYVDVAAVTGDPLDYVPEVAVPHVRAAAAWRLLELEGRGEADVDAWVDRLEAALKQRGERSPDEAVAQVESKENRPARFKGKTEMWSRDEGDDGKRPAELYLGTARRTTSTDLRTDLALVILEGAARMEPPWMELLKSGAAHSAEPVRWTAARLTRVLAAQKEGVQDGE